MKYLVITLLVGYLFSACKGIAEEKEVYCKKNNSPIKGKYFRKTPDVYSEYIEIIDDSLYKYSFHSLKGKDSCKSHYSFIGREFINGEFQCEIVFYNFRFFYKHLQSGDLNEIKDSLYTFYCPYKVTNCVATIVSDPFLESDKFEMQITKDNIK